MVVIGGFRSRSGQALPAKIRGASGRAIVATGKKVRMLAYSGGPLHLKEYPCPVVVDLDGMTIAAQKLPTPFDHNPDDNVGETDSVERTPAGIEATATLDTDTDGGKMIAAAKKGGFEWEASIGAPVQEMEEYGPGETVEVNGQKFAGPILVARKTTLEEISYVRRGADVGRTRVTIAARKGKGRSVMKMKAWLKAKGLVAVTAAALTMLRPMYEAEIRAAGGEPEPVAGDDDKFNAWIKEKGHEPDTLSDDLKATLRAAYDAECGDDPDDDDPDDDPMPVKASLRKEFQAAAADAFAQMQAVMEVAQMCKDHPDIKAQAIGKKGLNDGWTPERVKDAIDLKTLRASRATGPWIAGGQDQTATLDAMTGAMILRAGGKLDSKHYTGIGAVAMGLPAFLRAGLNTDQRQRAMEHAHRFSHYSLLDLCHAAIHLDGKNVPHDRSEAIRASFSGGSLLNIFTTSINAIILDTYLESPDTTAGWTLEGEVANFKTNDEIQLAKDGTGMRKLPRGGTAEHSKRSDRVESYRIERFAEQAQVDEQDVIDDTYDAIKDFPVEMGKKASRLRPDLVYGILLSNPTLNATGRALFNSTDANLGSSAALSSANLRAAIAAMLLVQDNGVNLNLRATHLIVPTTLEFLARELLHSAELILAGTSGSVTERGNKNVLAEEKLTIVSDSRLDNGVTNPKDETAYGGSTSTWYLACMMARTIRVAYLRGTGKAPKTRSFMLDKGQWGIGWDVNMDIGGAPLDWRGLRKTTA